MRGFRPSSPQSIPTDPAIMRLAHPVRCEAVDPEVAMGLAHMLSPSAWKEFAEAMRDDTKMSSSLLTDIAERPGFEHLKAMWVTTSRMAGASELGAVYSNLLMARHQLAPQPFFRIEDGLCDLLLHTDLDDDIPVEILQVPFNRFYVEFGSKRNLPLTLPNPVSGDHVLEGSYVEYGYRLNEENPSLYVMLTGSPLGKTNALDDTTYAINLAIEPGMSLKQALIRSFESAQKIARLTGLNLTPASSLNPSLECLNFLAKVLLYIGLPEARRTVHPEKSAWQKSHAGLKSPAKKQKAERKLRLLNDYILIEAPPAPAEQPAGESAQHWRTVKVHWRRGHYRMQAHGPQFSLRKLVFIRPTLVNADMGLPPADAPSYRVT